jgi:shikimate dehydrogenase
MQSENIVTGNARVAGIFGFPIEHTLSPCMQNAAFKHLGMNIWYLPFLVSPDMLKEAVYGLRAMSMVGVNVTLPHKENVIPMLDEVDSEALHIGAVNTIVNDNGKLVGFNTDGRGFMMSLSDAGVSAEGKKVLILGAGGAARAVGFCICRDASRVYIASRTAARATELCSRLNELRNNAECISMNDAESMDMLAETNIIINTTPLGLKDEDPPPINVSGVSERHVVCDLIYRKTGLLKEAEKKGSKTIDGSGMLLWQGAISFELWTGRKAPVDVMRHALLNKSC